MLTSLFLKLHSMMRFKRSMTVGALGALTALSMAGFALQAQTPPAARAGGGAYAPTVSVLTVQEQTVPIRYPTTGVAQAIESVVMRSKVNGVIDRIAVKEGQFVKKGDLLFQLNAQAAQAELHKAQAQLSKSKANLEDLDRQVQRSQELFAKQFISSSALDALQAQRQSQKAQVQADQAGLSSAQLQLNDHAIRAPFAGRIGAIDVSIGALVASGAGGTPLLTLTQLNPLAIEFRIPDTLLPRFLKAKKQAVIQVYLQKNEAAAVFKGPLTLIDNRVDAATASVLLKGKIKNEASNKEGSVIWPGQMVYVTVEAGTLSNVFVIPQASIHIQNDRRSVFVVGADHKVQLKPIVVEHTIGEKAVVSGLLNGDQVVVMGRQGLRPQMTVRTVAAYALN